MYSDSSSCDENFDPELIALDFDKEANLILNNLLPKKSMDKYVKSYKDFLEWKKKHGASFEENVFLEYFEELSKTLTPPTLWSIWSKLKATLSVYERIDLNKFNLLKTSLKNKCKGYKPKKSKILSLTQVNTFLQLAEDDIYLAMKDQPIIITASGKPIANNEASLTVGPRGPLLLQDHEFLEQISHFNRERIPERVVHAKGSGAFGYFEVVNNITKYTKAKLFSDAGKRTPIVVRFSNGAGQSESADTNRDIYGFAIKFFTSEGIWDLVTLNIPVLFIDDPIIFPDFVHVTKKNPQTHLSDADMFWDIITLRTEATHFLMLFFGDRAIPNGFTHMNGFSINTYKLVNASNEIHYCRFHLKTDQGIENLSEEKAAALRASDPDYNIRNLYNSIANGQSPSWTLCIQVMTPKQAQAFTWNPFDATKVWPHSEFPLITVGKLVINRNVKNHFADVEQAAYNPGNMVPGIEPSPDRNLHARIFLYGDAQRYRLGANHLQLPINCPYQVLTVMNYQRDGLMAFNNQSQAPNYFPNSFKGPKENPKVKSTSYHVSGNVDRYEDTKDDDFGQASIFYRKVLDANEKTRLIQNIVSTLKFASKFIAERAVKNFSEVDVEFGRRVAEGLRKEGLQISLSGKSASM